jgi:hypothetical protein
MLRSVGAVVLGFVVIALLAIGADLVMLSVLPDAFDASGGTDNPAILLLVQLYVGVFAVTGCWLAARLAPHSPMRHALVLGLLGLIFNIAGTVARWDHAPAWAHLLGLVLVMPYAWAGGRLREMQLERGPKAAVA